MMKKTIITLCVISSLFGSIPTNAMQKSITTNPLTNDLPRVNYRTFASKVSACWQKQNWLGKSAIVTGGGVLALLALSIGAYGTHFFATTSVKRRLACARFMDKHPLLGKAFDTIELPSLLIIEALFEKSLYKREMLLIHTRLNEKIKKLSEKICNNIKSIENKDGECPVEKIKLMASFIDNLVKIESELITLKCLDKQSAELTEAREMLKTNILLAIQKANDKLEEIKLNCTTNFLSSKLIGSVLSLLNTSIEKDDYQKSLLVDVAFPENNDCKKAATLLKEIDILEQKFIWKFGCYLIVLERVPKKQWCDYTYTLSPENIAAVHQLVSKLHEFKDLCEKSPEVNKVFGEWAKVLRVHLSDALQNTFINNNNLNFSPIKKPDTVKLEQWDFLFLDSSLTSKIGSIIFTKD